MDAEEVGRIVQEVRLGNRDAFSRLIKAYHGHSWRVAAAMLANIAQTENMVQQAFVNAYFSLDRFNPDEDFGTWIAAITRNIVRQELRRRTREANHLEKYREHLQQQFSEDTEHDNAQEAMTQALANCKEGLNDRARWLLDMRYQQQLGWSEIGQHLKSSEEACRKFLFRVRLQLRECIKKKMAQA